MLSQLIRSTFVRDALSLSGGTAIAQVIAIVSLPVLTRLYTPEDFGVLALYVAVASILSVFASLKLEQAIMLPDNDRDAASILLALLASSAVVSLTILLIVFAVGDSLLNYLDNQAYRPWLYLLPFSVFLMSSYQGLRFWQMRNKNFKLVSISLVSAISIGTVVSVVIGIWGKEVISGAAGLVIGFIAQGLVDTFVMLAGINKQRYLFKGINIKNITQSISIHKSLMTTLLVSHGISVICLRLPLMAISGLFGNAILGFYSMAERIVSAPTMLISSALGDVFRQRAAVSWREKGRFDDILGKTLLLTASIGIPIYTVGIFIAPDLFAFVFGEDWHVAGELASIILVHGMFSFIITPIDKGAIIVGAHRYIFNWHLARLLLYVMVIIVTILVAADVKFLIYGLVGSNIILSCVDIFYEHYFSLGRYKKA